MTKSHTIIYKTLHRKLEIEQYEHHNKSWMNAGAPEGLIESNTGDRSRSRNLRHPRVLRKDKLFLSH